MGRPKGAPNRMPRELKAAIIEAATLAGGEGGLVGYLTEMAKREPVAFMGLLARVLPIEAKARSAGNSAQVSFTVTWASPNCG